MIGDRQRPQTGSNYGIATVRILSGTALNSRQLTFLLKKIHSLGDN